jgi:Actinobacteria/chloroflexi VLRF1 release factor
VRWVSVAPERIGGWTERFGAGHGGLASSTVDSDAVVLKAVDGTVAECRVPFPPLVGADLVAHALRDRRVGVLLVRLGGHAAGIFVGTALVASKVGSRPVHGRSAAGGQSQQRFARRREGQARVALAAAADMAAAVLVPEVSTLDAVVLGGDRRAVDGTLADPRLTPLRPLVTGPLLDVPDPRFRVLEQAPALFRAVRIRLTDPPGARLGSGAWPRTS